MITNYVTFDFEWDISSGKLLCAAFVDDSGQSKVYHLADLPSEKDLILLVNNVLTSYPTSVGFWSTGEGSDLETLHRRSLASKVRSIVNPEKLHIEPIIGRVHIDLFKVFDKLVIKNYVYKKRYKDMKLDSIAKALLGYGKIGSGSQVGEMTVQQVKDYNLHDAKLTYELSRAGTLDKKTNHVKLDCALMNLMEALSQRTGLPLQEVCAFGMGYLWKKLMRDAKALPTDFTYRPQPGAAKRPGPFIMEPIAGDYVDVAVLDVASLYPTIVANHNVSPETMCCDCCKDVKEARVPGREEDLWICQKKEGKVKAMFVGLRRERLEHKRGGNKVMADGLKIVLNAKTGLFNNAFYEYADIRCYDTIIKYEWYYIKKIIAYAESIGVKLIYSDTDSLFIIYDKNTPGYHQCTKCGFGHMSAAIQSIIEYTYSLGVELEHEKTYQKLLITSKKHYIGVKDGQLVIAGMEGEKNDRPIWINRTFAQFTRDYAAGVDVVPNLKASWKMFEQYGVPIEELKFTIKLTMNASEYETGSMQKKLAEAANAKANDVISFYKTTAGVKLNALHSELSKKDYKEIFESTFEPALKLMGIPISRITEGSEQISLDSLFWSKAA